MKTRHLSSYFPSHTNVLHQVDYFAKKNSFAVSFHAKAERAMSRISDVVNKIMQISGEINTLRSCKLS